MEGCEDYADANGVAGWIDRDPFFRICILVEVIGWTVVALIASCCLCVARRICRRGKYSPSSTTTTSTNVNEVQQRDTPFGGHDTHTAGVADTEFAPSSSSRSACLLRFFASLAIAVLVGFTLMVALVAIFIPFVMPNMLYMPVDCEGDMFCSRVPGTENFFVTTESGNNVSIRLFPANPSGKYYQKRFSLMYSNPNGGYTTQAFYVYEKLSQFGINVYAWDYPGYKLSTGTPTYTSVMEAGEAVLRFVAAHSIKRPEDVILLGRSLGGAVAIALAQRFRSKALVLLNPLDSLQSLLGDCCVLSGWASGLHYASGHFDAAASLSYFDGCLFHYAADEDVIVYYQRQRKLFFEYSGNKDKRCSVFVKGKCMGHNNDQWELDSFVKAMNVYLTRLDI